MVQTIFKLTKPSLVDLLRICDKNRWCSPRIRYASIRSKPELCKDLMQHFDFVEIDNGFIRIRPRRVIRDFPDLKYHQRSRRFWMDGEPFDAARVSRERPQFQMEHKRTTLYFGTLQGARDSGIAAAASLMFPAPG